MAVAHDVQTTAAFTASTSFSHAGSASAKAAVVLIHTSGSTDEVTAVTYGGVNMVEAGTTSETTEAGNVQIWYLLNPPTGTQTVAITCSASTAKRYVVATMTCTSGSEIRVAGNGYATGTSASVANPSWNITGLTANENVQAYEVIHSGLQTMTTTPQTTPAWTLISSNDLGSIGNGFARINNTPTGTTLASGWIAATADDYVGASIAFRETLVIGKAADLRYNTKLAVGDQAEIDWAVKQNVSDDAQLVWNTQFGASATPVGDTVQLVHNVRAAVGDTAQLVANTRQAVSDQADLRYAVKAVLGDVADLRWPVKTALGDTVQLVHKTRALAADSAILRHNTRALIADTADLRWPVRTVVGGGGSPAVYRTAAGGMNLPTGRQVGDRMFGFAMIVCNADGSIGSPTFSAFNAIAGWSIVSQTGGGTGFGAALYTKIADGTSADAFTYSFSANGDDTYSGSHGQMVASGVSSYGVGTWNSANNATPTNLPAGASGDLLFNFIGTFDVGAITGPSGESVTMDYQTGDGTRVLGAYETQGTPSTHAWAGSGANSWISIGVYVRGGASTPTQKQLLWRVKQTAGDQADLRHKTRALASDQTQLVWNVLFGLGAVGKNVDLRYAVRQALGDTASLLHNTRAAIGDPADLQWRTRALAGDQADLRYAVRTALGDTSILRYAVRTSLGDQADLRWAVRAALGDTAALRWNTRATIADAADLRWAVRTALGDTASLRWAVRTFLGDTADLRWNARAAAGDQAVLVWNTAQLAATAWDTIQLMWNTRAVLGDQVVLRHATRGLVADATSLVWMTRSLATDQIDLRYGVRTLVADQAILRYAVRIALGDQTALRWAVRSLAHDDLTILWAVVRLVLAAETGSPVHAHLLSGAPAGVLEAGASPLIVPARYGVRTTDSRGGVR